MNYSYISTLDPFSESFTNSYKSNYSKKDYFIYLGEHVLPKRGRGERGRGEHGERLPTEITNEGSRKASAEAERDTPKTRDQRAAQEAVQQAQPGKFEHYYTADGPGTRRGAFSSKDSPGSIEIRDDAKGLGLPPEEAYAATEANSEFNGKKNDPSKQEANQESKVKELEYGKSSSVLPDKYNEIINKFEKQITDLKNNRKLKDEQLQAYHKYLNKLGEQFSTNTGIKVPDNVKEALKDPSNSKNKPIIDKYFEKGGKYEKAMEAKKSELDNRETLKAKKGEPKVDPKLIGKILLFLQFAATLAAALYFLNAYANAHTGCMQITKPSKDSPETQKKIMCDNDTFTPNTCFCLYPDDTSSPEKSSKPCDKDSGSGSNATEPRPVQKGNPHCLGTVFDIDKHLYYAYQIMDPASAALDIFKKGADIAESGFDKFLKSLEHFAIIAGIVLGVLFVLFIIFKIFTGGSHSSKVPVQKVEFVPAPVPSAPSVPSVPSVPSATSFGRNYFGNLSKYRVR